MSNNRRGPDIKLDIKRPYEPVSQNSKTFWAPVGDVALWRDEKTGKWSGKVRIFALGAEFNAFEFQPREEEGKKKAYAGEEPAAPVQGEFKDSDIPY